MPLKTVTIKGEPSEQELRVIEREIQKQFPWKVNKTDATTWNIPGDLNLEPFEALSSYLEVVAAGDGTLPVQVKQAAAQVSAVSGIKTEQKS